jgi:hypothetical protein
MVGEQQLSLCFESEVGEARPALPHLLLSELAATQQQSATVLCLRHFKRQGAFAADANSVRLLEKIARKVKYF